jgi:hypothetical protein
MSDDKGNGSHDVREWLTLVLLGLAAIATAWATFQAAHWRSEQALAGNRATTARVQATREADVANRQIVIDVTTFAQWVDAYGTGNTELADFYFRRFRPEFRPAVTAWVATKPLQNPKAPLTPFAMPQYHSEAQQQSDALEAEAGVNTRAAEKYVTRADYYSLAVVLFASSLFFAGVSSRLSGRPRNVLLTMGWTLFAGAIVWMATLPANI